MLTFQKELMTLAGLHAGAQQQQLLSPLQQPLQAAGSKGSPHFGGDKVKDA